MLSLPLAIISNMAPGGSARVIARALGTIFSFDITIGLSRMTVQRTEAGKIDPRLSTLLVLARALDMDLMLVPTSLRSDLENFVRSGGQFLGQPSGISAPTSLVDELLQTSEPVGKNPVRAKRKR